MQKKKLIDAIVSLLFIFGCILAIFILLKVKAKIDEAGMITIGQTKKVKERGNIYLKDFQERIKKLDISKVEYTRSLSGLGSSIKVPLDLIESLLKMISEAQYSDYITDRWDVPSMPGPGILYIDFIGKNNEHLKLTMYKTDFALDCHDDDLPENKYFSFWHCFLWSFLYKSPYTQEIYKRLNDLFDRTIIYNQTKGKQSGPDDIKVQGEARLKEIQSQLDPKNILKMSCDWKEISPPLFDKILNLVSDLHYIDGKWYNSGEYPPIEKKYKTILFDLRGEPGRIAITFNANNIKVTTYILGGEYLFYYYSDSYPKILEEVRQLYPDISEE